MLRRILRLYESLSSHTHLRRFIVVNKINLLGGGLSLVVVVFITNIQFALKVVLPAYGIFFVGWISSRTCRLELSLCILSCQIFGEKKMFEFSLTCNSESKI